MADNVHIEHIVDTRANIRANMDEWQLGFCTDINSSDFDADQVNCMVHMNASTARAYVTPVCAYIDDPRNGDTVTWLDVDFSDVTARDNLYVGEYIYHHGDTSTDNYIQLQEDRQTYVVGGVTMIDIVEDASDYIDFASNLMYLDITNSGVIVGSATQLASAKMTVLDASNPQAVFAQDATHYLSIQVDSNHDATIKPTATGQIKFQATTDSTDFFQVLDADGGTPILNVDSVNEWVGFNASAPTHLITAATAGETSVRVTSTVPAGGDLYLIHDSPTVGFNTYFDGSWKYGKGSVSKYAGYIQYDFSEGNITFWTSAAAGNADAAATISERLRILKDGEVAINHTAALGSARLTVLDGTNPQITFAQAADKYGSIKVNSSGNIGVTQTGYAIGLGTDTPIAPFATERQVTISNYGLAGGLVGLWLQDVNGASDEKLWDIISNSGTFELQTVNDAVSSAKTALKVTRSGFTLSTIELNTTRDDCDFIINGDTSAFCTFDAGEEVAYFPDNKKVVFGNSAAAPDAKIGWDTTPTTDSLILQTSNFVISDTADKGATGYIDIYQNACPTSSYLNLRHGQVAHGVTTVADTTTFGFLDVLQEQVGGLNITGIADAVAATAGVRITGIAPDAPCGDLGYVQINGAEKNGTGIASVDDDNVIMSVLNNTAYKSKLFGNGNFEIVGNLKMQVFNQSAEPTTGDITSGYAAIWTDTDDSKCYLCYNHGGTVKTVELT